MHPFSTDALMEIYQNITFPQQAYIFECFFLENYELPRNNPPYYASIFPKISRQVISMVTCLLGYHSDKWVDEVVLGFLSVFLVGQKPSVLFNYIRYLSDVIHE